MQGDSFARLTKNLEVYKYVNEDTFLNAIISFLLKPQYKTPLNSTNEAEDLTAN